MNSTEASVALNLIPSMGPVRLKRLLDAFGSPEQVLRTSQSKLQSVEGIGAEVASNIARWEELTDLRGELKEAEHHDIRILAWDSPEYPDALREIHDPPIVLYMRGSLLPRDRHAVAVVGARNTTHYGLECAKKLSYQLAYAGLTVFSGLARGIDTAAHQGALAAKGRTVAVIGSGLLELYPPENAGLADLIAGSGAVLSEFPLHRKPDKQTFPMRNRIVSGCSFGILVVEAGLNSGALITANQAAEQGRSVYAVPGPIDRPSSKGSNRLIQQGARLVTGAEDILDDMGTLFPKAPDLQPPRAIPELAENERAVYDALGDEEEHLDQIISKSRLPTGIVSSSLLGLELRRLVKQLPGNRFVKLI